jgi:heat shock protein HslJ
MKRSIAGVALLVAAYSNGPIISSAEDGSLPHPQVGSIPSTLIGDWNVAKIEDRPTVGGRRLAIKISLDGEVSGDGGCNAFGTRASVSGDEINFQPVISTKRGCEVDIVRQEQHLTWALRNTHSWTFDAVPGLLELKGRDGKPLVSMSRR